jgi:hypothetical protein
MAREELYPFRYKDPVTGKWVRARYRASLDNIAARYATWELTGAPSVPAPTAGGYNPHRRVVSHRELSRISEPPLKLVSSLEDGVERALVRIFLRRYVTYCARRGRFAQMNGAAQLLRRTFPTGGGACGG